MTPQLWVRCTAWRKLRKRRPPMVKCGTSTTTSRPIGTASIGCPTVSLRHSLKCRSAAGQYDDLPAPAATHTNEIGYQSVELGGIADRVATDYGEPKPDAVSDRRGFVGVEVIALGRMHGKRRQRIPAVWR